MIIVKTEMAKLEMGVSPYLVERCKNSLDETVQQIQKKTPLDPNELFFSFIGHPAGHLPLPPKELHHAQYIHD